MRRPVQFGAGLAVALTLLVGVSAAHAKPVTYRDLAAQLGATSKPVVKDGVVTVKTARGTATFPAKPTTPAKLKAKAAQSSGGNIGGVPVPDGAYFHLNQACGLGGTAVGYYWANQSTNFLSIYGVPWAAQVAYSYQMIREGGIAWIGDYYRWSNTIVQCHEYVGDRANSVRDPYGSSVNYQDGCDSQIIMGGWDDGGWNMTITGWVVSVSACNTPSL